MTGSRTQLRWTHQARFAGFFATDQKGYFSRRKASRSFFFPVAPACICSSRFWMALHDLVLSQQMLLSQHDRKGRLRAAGPAWPAASYRGDKNIQAHAGGAGPGAASLTAAQSFLKNDDA